jgi:hypothetical protein
LHDNSVDVNTRTRDAYANFCAHNSPIGGGPPWTPYQPSDGPCHGQTHVQSPYCPLVMPTRDRSQRQTTIPETFGRTTCFEDQPHDINPPSHGIGHTIVGGAIVSPRHSNREMYARTLGASCFDIIHLATKEYHVGMDGIDTLTEENIQACGYAPIKASIKDVVVCYNDIILIHNKVSGYAHTLGPQVD